MANFQSFLTPRVRLLMCLAAALAIIAIVLTVAVQPAGPSAPAAAAAKPAVAPALATPDSPAAMTSAQQLLPSGSAKLTGPPAGLPVYPGAAVMLAYGQGEGAAREETAVYTIPAADAAAVMTFYAAELERRGYARPARPDENPLSAVYQKDGQIVLLRLRQTAAAARLTLIVRYTK